MRVLHGRATRPLRAIPAHRLWSVPAAFAEFVTVRADELFELPASVHLDEQPLVEPLAIMRRAFRRGEVTAADRVAVLGAGPIGLAAVAWAVAIGVEAVVVSEPSALRRDLASRLGAVATFDPTEGGLAGRGLRGHRRRAQPSSSSAAVAPGSSSRPWR